MQTIFEIWRKWPATHTAGKQMISSLFSPCFVTLLFLFFVSDNVPFYSLLSGGKGGAWPLCPRAAGLVFSFVKSIYIFREVQTQGSRAFLYILPSILLALLVNTSRLDEIIKFVFKMAGNVLKNGGTCSWKWREMFWKMAEFVFKKWQETLFISCKNNNTHEGTLNLLFWYSEKFKHGIWI